MAQAYGNFDDLPHQLRFLLFEIGIGFSQAAIDNFITRAHKQCLYRLHHAQQIEQLTNSPILTHHVHDFLDQLRASWQKQQPHVRFYPWASFQRELDETIANEAMAMAYRNQWDASLQRQAHKYHTLWQYVIETIPWHKRLSFFEQWGSLGHRYHPNFRAKIGLSRREVMQYSPEFQSVVSLNWCGLHRQLASTSQQDTSYKNLLDQSFPQQMLEFKERLKLRHLNPDDYLPIPLHPWQLRNKVLKYFSNHLDDKTFIPYVCSQSATPSMSFRTLIPNSPQSFHIKCATAIHTTSAMRTVSPASVYNGPKLSNLINHILHTNNHFNQSLYLAADTCGIHINKLNHDTKHLSALFRQNPNHHAKNDETILPLACLFALSPISHKPLLVELIELSKQTPENYFKNYVQLLLKGQLHCYLRFGIALESHQQNTLCVFKNHLPVKHIMRDLGGIRIYPDMANKSGFDINLYPNSLIVSNNLNEVRNKFIHANFQSNLAYWISGLCSHFALDAKSLWQLVKTELITLVKSIPAQKHVIEEQMNALLTKPWQHKCLVRMRLEPTQGQYIYRQLQNPLAKQ
jgi:staphyloferrin A synthase